MTKSKLWSASEIWGCIPYNDIENEADKPKWIPVKEHEIIVRKETKAWKKNFEAMQNAFNKELNKNLVYEKKVKKAIEDTEKEVLKKSVTKQEKAFQLNGINVVKEKLLKTTNECQISRCQKKAVGLK